MRGENGNSHLIQVMPETYLHHLQRHRNRIKHSLIISKFLITKSYATMNKVFGCFFMKSNLRHAFQYLKTLVVYGKGFIKVLPKYKFSIFHIIGANSALSVCFSVLMILQQDWKRRKPKVISV